MGNWAGPPRLVTITSGGDELVTSCMSGGGKHVAGSRDKTEPAAPVIVGEKKTGKRRRGRGKPRDGLHPLDSRSPTPPPFLVKAVRWQGHFLHPRHRENTTATWCRPTYLSLPRDGQPRRAAPCQDHASPTSNHAGIAVAKLGRHCQAEARLSSW